MEVIKKEFHGRELSIESGRIAKQAGGSALITCGDSIVLVTACVGEAKKGLDFFPLTIDYIEKTYAAGRIPGGFFKREGRLGEKEILTSRIIDRPCRPLFPDGFRRETQVTATVLSADPDVDTDIMALCGASTALTISDAPFEGPIAGVRVVRIKGELKINPSPQDYHRADLNMIVAGTRDAIVMVEGGAQEVPEAEVLEALFFAHQELQHVIDMQLELQKKVGKEKMVFLPPEVDVPLTEKAKALVQPKILAALTVKDKLERKVALKALKTEIVEALVPEDDEDADANTKTVKNAFEEAVSDNVRTLLFDKGVRIDGRDPETVRNIDIEVGLIPRSHGSALFTRGETQAIITATLGVADDAQRIDGLLGEDRKRFMLHYNFPPFSVGETRPLRGPGRREIGHGALAERAVRAVLPEYGDDFPYTVRIVSEITESNGSSSMASVCGASLALMDAGINLKAPVAGVAMGLLVQGDKHSVLTDILGDEDHLGDMDFKVCGTETGITALQMDIKIKGLKAEIMSAALDQAKNARIHILEKMNEVIKSARTETNPNAPQIVSFKVNKEKIRDLIGPGGKTIKSITESCSVRMDISDDGTVMLSGGNRENIDAALKICNSLTEEAEIGKIYHGIVRRIADFGAFVEIFPGTDGLVHISQLAEERVNRVNDVVQEGDQIYVKVLDVDHQGKVRLSKIEAEKEMAEAS